MNDHDPLVAELAALHPREPSPHLRQRIADELTVTASTEIRSRSRHDWWNGAIAGSLIAACLVAGWFLLSPAPTNNRDRDLPLLQSQIDVVAAFDDALPTVWTYQRALAHSPQEFEALLDKHAAVAPSHDLPGPRHLFIHSDAQLLFQGEL